MKNYIMNNIDKIVLVAGIAIIILTVVLSFRHDAAEFDKSGRVTETQYKVEQCTKALDIVNDCMDYYEYSTEEEL